MTVAEALSLMITFATFDVAFITLAVYKNEQQKMIILEHLKKLRIIIYIQHLGQA